LTKSGTPPPPPPAGGELNHEQFTYSVQRFRTRKGTEIQITLKRKINKNSNKNPKPEKRKHQKLHNEYHLTPAKKLKDSIGHAQLQRGRSSI
jgi:hypothetical protein